MRATSLVELNQNRFDGSGLGVNHGVDCTVLLPMKRSTGYVPRTSRREGRLDLLEQDSGSSRVRQRRFASVGPWAITVQERLRAGWFILGEPAGSDAAIRDI